MKDDTPTKKKRTDVSDDTRALILELHDKGYGTRKINPRVGCSRKIVRLVLREEGRLKNQAHTQPTKLLGFEEAIEERVKKALTITRIHREIKELGYTGGRTILAERVRALRKKHAIETAKKKVTTRFETRPGEEMQIDWSPYQVEIGGKEVVVKAFGCLLGYSRKLFLRFFDNERQTTLFEALAMAFEYFDGAATQVVLDNMATAIVARYGPGGKPIFQQPFLDLAAHYGFAPYPCHVRHADRKGKKEKSFRLVESDFLRGSVFASMDDLNHRANVWLDETPGCANLRTHGTTNRVPNELYRDERDLLIRLPEQRFTVFERTIRVVDADCTISVRGNRYSIPASFANSTVAVHLFAEHFEVVDRYGHIVFSRRYVNDEDKGPPVIDPTHYQSLPRRSRQGGLRLHEAFVLRFPQLEALVVGLFEKMKSLTPIHLRALLRLVEQYGEEAFLAAAIRAQEHRRFDAWAVQRILEMDHGAPEFTVELPLGGIGPMRIGDVDYGSLDDYSHLDADEATTPTDDEDQE